MTDISDVLFGMASRADPSRWKDGAELADRFSLELAAAVRWDQAAGENWAVVSVTTVRAFVGIRWPVVIVARRDEPLLRPLMRPDLLVVAVSNMDEPELEASAESVHALYGAAPVSAALRPQFFSASDFWFATV